MEVGCGTITVVDYTASGVRGAPSEASDGHSGNVEKVIAPPIRRGKSLRRHHLRVMKAS